MEKLPGDYIAGFVDGEGCFALKFRRDVRRKRKGSPVYFYWDIEFAILLKGDDKDILEKIRNTLDCGQLGNVDKRGTIRYAVNNLNELRDKVIPFFEQYPLRAKKRFDFKLWKEALDLLYKNKGLKTNIASTGNSRGTRKRVWDPKELEMLKEIQDKMSYYKGGNRKWKWL